MFAFVDTGPLERGALGGGSVAFICQACAIGFVCMGSRPPARMLWALRSPRFAPVARGPRHAMSEPSTRTGTLKIHLYRSEDEGPLPGSLLLDGSCLDGLQVSDVLGAYLYDKWKRRQESRYEDYYSRRRVVPRGTFQRRVCPCRSGFYERLVFTEMFHVEHCSMPCAVLDLESVSSGD